jgi:hypothetical protein
MMQQERDRQVDVKRVLNDEKRCINDRDTVLPSGAGRMRRGYNVGAVAQQRMGRLRQLMARSKGTIE